MWLESIRLWGVDEIKSYLKDNLKPSRYGHTLGVVKTAIELAEIYNEDKQKAEIAALCHDIAKNMSYEDMLKVKVENREDLSVAYTPGVAEPCRRISENKEDVYKYTAKGNLVAVVSDGSAVLGLGAENQAD